jgi:hypothetical protein
MVIHNRAGTMRQDATAPIPSAPLPAPLTIQVIPASHGDRFACSRSRSHVLHAAYRAPLTPTDLAALWPAGPMIGGPGPTR